MMWKRPLIVSVKVQVILEKSAVYLFYVVNLTAMALALEDVETALNKMWKQPLIIGVKMALNCVFGNVLQLCMCGHGGELCVWKRTVVVHFETAFNCLYAETALNHVCKKSP